MTPDDSSFLSHLQQLILQGETDALVSQGPDAARKLVSVMSESSPLSARAFEISADILHLIPDSFRPELAPLLAALFRPAPRAERAAQRLLARLAALFDPAELLAAALSSPDSVALLHFANDLVQRRPKLLRAADAGRLLALCLHVCLGCRERSAMRAAIFLLTGVHDQCPAAYREFVATARDDARDFLSRLQLGDADGREEEEEEPPQPPQPLDEGAAIERLVARVDTEPEKGPAIRAIAAYVTANEGRGLDVALPRLVRMSKGQFAADVERALQVIGAHVDSPDVLDAAIPLLGEEDPEVFIEFLTRVVACAAPEDLEVRVTHIMRRITPLLHHQAPTVRKDSVLCVVEMRVVLGAAFDREISGLKPLPRKLVLHYLDKRLGG